MKVYASVNDIPASKPEDIVVNPSDDVNYVKPKRPNSPKNSSGAETIIKSVMFMAMIMMVLI